MALVGRGSAEAKHKGYVLHDSIYKMLKRGLAEWLTGLPSKSKALNSNPSTKKKKF
jgi:hypothetical protein